MCISSQHTMMLSGQLRGVKVRQMVQKLLSPAHWMIWSKCGNGEFFLLLLNTVMPQSLHSLSTFYCNALVLTHQNCHSWLIL